MLALGDEIVGERISTTPGVEIVGTRVFQVKLERCIQRLAIYRALRGNIVHLRWIAIDTRGERITKIV